MRACKDCRHYRYGLRERLSFVSASDGAICAAVEPEVDKVTGETYIPRRSCWRMRLSDECGPEGKLWGPF